MTLGEARIYLHMVSLTHQYDISGTYYSFDDSGGHRLRCQNSYCDGEPCDEHKVYLSIPLLHGSFHHCSCIPHSYLVWRGRICHPSSVLHVILPCSSSVSFALHVDAFPLRRTR
jgi:hypothetical protein